VTHKAKSRFHAYDVFLSHNRDDGSHLLRDALIEHGVSAWHDNYADMTDRQVQQRVWSALSQSRYICVCIPDGFRDSEWVRVEYTTGLRIEQRFSIPRVIVALMGRSPAVPTALGSQRRFNLVGYGVKSLAEFLVRENARTAPDSQSAAADGGSEAIRLHNNRKLRDLLSDHSHFKLSPIERLRLGRERLGVLLAAPPGEHTSYLVSDLTYEISGGPYGGMALGDDSELELLCMDIFEALSMRPLHVLQLDQQQHWWLPLSQHGVFDPLGRLIANPAHRSRAQATFTAICDVLAGPDNPNQVTRRDMRHFRRFADDIAAGASYTDARQHLTMRLTRELHRPWWRFW
jgi:hypothetical protein